MLSWLPRRRARIESIEAEAEALVRDFGEAAYSAARRREREARAGLENLDRSISGFSA
jgi:hypothetical protein